MVCLIDLIRGTAGQIEGNKSYNFNIIAILYSPFFAQENIRLINQTKRSQLKLSNYIFQCLKLLLFRYPEKICEINK